MQTKSYGTLEPCFQTVKTQDPQLSGQTHTLMYAIVTARAAGGKHDLALNL